MEDQKNTLLANEAEAKSYAEEREKQKVELAEAGKRGESVEAELHQRETVIEELTAKLQEVMQNSAKEVWALSEKENSLASEKRSLEEAVESMKEDRSRLEVRLGDAEEEKRQLTETIKQMERDFGLRIKEMSTERESLQKATDSQAESLQSELASALQKLQEREGDLEAAKAEVLASKDLNEEMKEKYCEVQKKNVENEEVTRKLETQLAQQENRLGHLTAEVENLQSTLDQKNTEIQTLKQQREEQISRCKGLESSLDSVSGERDRAQTDISTLSEENLRLESRIRDTEINLAKATDLNLALKEELDGATESWKKQMRELAIWNKI